MLRVCTLKILILSIEVQGWMEQNKYHWSQLNIILPLFWLSLIGLLSFLLLFFHSSVRKRLISLCPFLGKDLDWCLYTSCKSNTSITKKGFVLVVAWLNFASAAKSNKNHLGCVWYWYFENFLEIYDLNIRAKWWVIDWFSRTWVS